MRNTIALATLATTALLTGCSGDETSEDTRTAGEVAASAYAESPEAADDVDLTADLTVGQPWADAVTSAIQTDPNRVEVDTTIVDPRGENGSPEAQQAIAICQGTVAWLQEQGAVEPHVRVMEADGTTFAVYSQTAVGDLVPAQECSEY